MEIIQQNKISTNIQEQAQNSRMMNLATKSELQVNLIVVKLLFRKTGYGQKV